MVCLDAWRLRAVALLPAWWNRAVLAARVEIVDDYQSFGLQTDSTLTCN